ncbi:MAG: HEAT repeat domain-containing protein [Nitrospiraceae bacterium]|nr:HEAT repeat domain-containing protein [Nitrospiraceae bacterium]
MTNFRSRRYQKISVSLKSAMVVVAFVVSLCGMFLITKGNVYADDIDKLILKLQHNDLRVRILAIEELGRIRDDESVRALMSVIENQGEDWKIQIRVVKLLAEIKNPRAVDLLIKVLDDPFFTYDCPALKWNAALALGNFKNYSKVVDVLIDALTDKTLYVREAAMQSLGNIGDRKAVPYLISALSDKSFAIRMSAIKALGKTGDESAIPFVKRVLDNDADPHIRDEAVKALRKLNEN